VAPLYKNVFSDRRNLLYDKSASFRCDGRPFHSTGPTAANALSPEGAVYPRHDSQRMWRFNVSDKAGYLDNFYVRQNGQICPTSQRFSDKNAGSVRKIQICPTEKSDVPDKSRYVPQSTKRQKIVWQLHVMSDKKAGYVCPT